MTSLSFVRRCDKCATMRPKTTPASRPGPASPAAGTGRRRRLVLFTLALATVGSLVGCDDGGGGFTFPTGPTTDWPRWRRNDLNSAVGGGTLSSNMGLAEYRYEHAAGGTTSSGAPPILGRNRTIYLGTNEGVLSLDSEGNRRWLVDECAVTGVAVGTVSHVSIGPNGRDIILSSDGSDEPSSGGIFLLREDEEGDEAPACIFSFPVGSRSAAMTLVDQVDLTALSFIAGTQAGNVVSLNDDGLRRWSFPEVDIFDSEVSSTPAMSGLGLVFSGPDGRLHSLGRFGRPRWSARIGDAYAGDEPIPSPVVFGQIFTVSSAGVAVGFNSAGTRLWTFTPETPISGSLAASPITAAGGVFIGENVVYALDRTGTLYGIGGTSGELLRFCENENRACRPSTCPDEAPCDSVMRCSTTTATACETAADCPEGESCGEQFRCSNAPDTTCTQDLCATTAAAGSCTRRARHPLSLEPATFRSSPVVSADGFVAAVSEDGRLCVRRLDGSIPAGTCNVSGASCTPDSCGGGDTCCRLGETGCAPGRCKLDAERFCTLDTCPTGESCNSVWSGGGGCIALPDYGDTPAIPSLALDVGGRIFVATEKGLVVVQ